MTILKNTLALIVLFAVAVAAAFLIGRWSGAPRETPVAQETTDDSDAEAPDAEEILFWTCSMHPHVNQPGPGSCPICNMDLIPVSDASDREDGDLPRLRVSERAAALMRVETWPAERRAAAADLRFLGTLEMDETLLRDVVVRSESYVEKLHADYEWKMVGPGEPLAELYSPEVRAAARELLVESNRIVTGREGGSPASAKLRRLGVPENEIERILETGEVPRTYEIRSPIGGHVMHLEGREGDWLPEGRRLVQIMDPSTLWVQLEAYERDLAWLKTGLPVAFSFEAFPGEVFEGEVSFISPHVQPRKRTTQVRVEVPNPEGRLKPGMFARGTVRAAGNDDEPSIVIPKSAPLITGKRAVVYVQLPDRDRPTFEGRDVVLGPRVGDHYVVREGIEEGELVVSRGNFKIDSELQIRGRVSMMAPEGGGAPSGHDHGGMATDGGETPAHDHRAQAGVPDAVEEALSAEFDPAEVPEEFARRAAAIFEVYVGLTEALAADDFQEARRHLIDLHDRIERPDADLLEGTPSETWAALAQEVIRLTHEMAEVDDMSEFRRYLEPLTTTMEVIATRFAAGEIGPVYRMQCFMAIDDRPAEWLQTHDEVVNPYLGEASGMLRCGEVLGTLGDE